MDEIILGFLMYGEMSGYMLKKAIESGPSFFTNVSFGSIYPSLGRLERNGFVEMKEVVDGKRLKKLYTLLPKGEAAFLHWLKEPIRDPRSPSGFLTKIFFYEFLESDEVVTQLSVFLKLLNAEIEQLSKLSCQSQTMTSAYQFSTLRYGLSFYGFLKDWMEALIIDVASFPKSDRLRYQIHLK